MLDPRMELLTELISNEMRVVFASSPIVLLCGGEFQQKNNPDDPDPQVKSVRESIIRCGTDYEIFCPEEITNWNEDGCFRNLMDFEKDLAGICSLIVVILEAPGAIAELGAFSQLPEMKKKIIAVQASKYLGHESFINLGILRYIQKDKQSSVKTYPWCLRSPPGKDHQIVQDIIEDIKNELKTIPKSKVFDSNDTAHVMILIYDFINLFIALKESEVRKFLKILNVECTAELVRRRLFLLERFDLIKKISYSDSDFYVKGKFDYHHLRLPLKGKQPFDRSRMPLECMRFYEESRNEVHRLRAVRNEIKNGRWQ